MPKYIEEAYPAPPEKPDYQKMAGICRQSVSAHPEDREYLLTYEAIFLGMCGLHEQAVAQCRSILPALTNADCISDAQNCLVRNLQQMGDVAGARQALIEQMEFADSIYYTCSQILELSVLLKDHDAVIRYGLQLADEGEVDREVLIQIADAYEAKKDYLNSAKFLEKAARHGSDETSWLWSNAGRALALAGETEEAMFYFKMVLKLKPDSHMAHYYMGLTYQNKEDIYRALHHYTEALKIKPDFAEVYNNLAVISYHENSNINEAIQHLEKALEANPDKTMLTRLYVNLAKLYKRIADYDLHAYYMAKVMQTAGFDVEPDTDADEQDDEDDLV